MVAQLQTPGQGMERPRYQTYEANPNHIFVSGTYFNVNGGYSSYMGGIKYLYWSLGGTRVQIRNFATDDYSLNQGGAASGIFDFDYGNRLSSIQAQLCSLGTRVTSGTANQRGCVAAIEGSFITLFFYDVVAGAKVPYVLQANDCVHLELVLRRYIAEGEGL